MFEIPRTNWLWEEILDPGIAIVTALAALIGWLLALRIRKLERQRQRQIEDNTSSIIEQLDRLDQRLSEVVNDVSLDSLEVVATEIADGPHASPSATQTPDAETRPRNEAAMVETLRKHEAPLDWDNLEWRRKVNPSSPRGNLGWFVHSNDPGPRGRWFVHSGRSTSARVALPLGVLRAWEERTGLEPTDIQHDYRLGNGSGRHAWYVKTYDGRKWRIASRKRKSDGFIIDELSDREE